MIFFPVSMSHYSFSFSISFKLLRLMKKFITDIPILYHYLQSFFQPQFLRKNKLQNCFLTVTRKKYYCCYNLITYVVVNVQVNYLNSSSLMSPCVTATSASLQTQLSCSLQVSEVAIKM